MVRRCARNGVQNTYSHFVAGPIELEVYAAGLHHAYAASSVLVKSAGRDGRTHFLALHFYRILVAIRASDVLAHVLCIGASSRSSSTGRVSVKQTERNGRGRDAPLNEWMVSDAGSVVVHTGVVELSDGDVFECSCRRPEEGSGGEEAHGGAANLA